MQPKQKAEQLVKKFLPLSECNVYPKTNQIEQKEFTESPQFENARQCALIVAQEMLNSEYDMPAKVTQSYCKFWFSVTREITELSFFSACT